MPDVKRTVKLVTTQHIMDDQSEAVQGNPMRSWSIKVYLVGPDGEELPAICYDKVTYVLHDTFGPKRMKQIFKQPPFEIVEKGWGEFEMQVVLTPVGMPKADQTLHHDLNFQNEQYESTHQVTFRNPKPDLLERLKESAPAGEAVNGAAGGKSERKRPKTTRNVDMEKLAEALPQLQDDDLLQVVQMVHDNKTEDTYTKNDVENGEFHVDLYTLPDPLIKMLWDFTEKRVDMSIVA